MNRFGQLAGHAYAVVVTATLSCLLFPSQTAADLSDLPMGAAPAPIVSPYFPSRAHEFVFRNWTVVPEAKLAEVLGTETSNVTALAESMGLPADPEVPKAMARRGYISIIRRNWHLLPYSQLATLLDMTPEVLDEKLREEDFLWVKLGRLKPDSPPLTYTAPDEAAKARAAEIARVVHRDFGEALNAPGEDRFAFVDELAAPIDMAQAGEKDETVRIVYSYVALFGDPLLNPELNPYPDGLLQRLAEAGINGVWLHAVLRDLAPGGEAFPEFGAHHETRLKNLQMMVDRAKQFGIQIYLYVNEPRAMPHAFFEQRPELKGVAETELTALCTSQPVVRQWLGDSLAHVFREVKGLGGIYAITASENLTNCASHGDWKSCTRCAGRTDAEIIAEVVQVLEEGVHRSAPEAKVLISDWGWRGHGDAPDIIAQLPDSVWLMSVSEWHLPIERGGIASTVGEYSISSVGPGPRAPKHWAEAQTRNLKIGTEIQFNNTCEIASVPYLPVLDLVAEHCINLRPFNLDAMFIGWTMGGHPSPNFMVAERLARTPHMSAEEALDDVAQSRYGIEGAAHARRAWSKMSSAFRQYPFHISVVYTCPVQWGPANPIYATPTGYSATMWGLPYDNLDGWRGPYPPEVFAAQFEKVAAGWDEGLKELAEAASKTPPHLRKDAEADWRYGRAAAIHFRSVANQTRYVMARNTLLEGGERLSPEQQTQHRDQLRASLESEIGLAKELYALTKADSRIGFEPSCQYFYLPQDLVEKVVNCRWLLEQLDE